MNRLVVSCLVPALGGGLIVASVAGEEPAAASQRPARECFFVRQVNGFTSRNNEEVDIRVGANRHYRLSLTGYCPDIDFSHSVALRARGGSSSICVGGDAEILTRGPTGAQSCFVNDIRRLTPEEVNARNRRH
ncbi:MAG: hypothetical protein QOH47_1720 [Sphingomonadales bacterium]|jgi:hypothetical protein|nr:hypothetical protein [Sphingomonadales bacterium]